MHTVKLRSLDKLLLALIFLILSASTIAWTIANRTPPAWDPSDHMLIAYDYYLPVAHLDWTAFREEFFVAPHFYAPLVHLITAGVFLVLGASRLTGIVVNLMSLAVLLLSVSWIGRRLYSQEDEARDASRADSLALAVVAPLLATSYHFSAWLLHDAFLDYPLTAIVALSFALLINAGDFKQWRSALIFGLSAGLGMLTKQTFAFFLVLPAVYVTGRVLLSRDLKALGNLVLAGIAAAALASIWYWPHLHHVIEIYQVNKQAAVSENEAPLFTFSTVPPVPAPPSFLDTPKAAAPGSEAETQVQMEPPFQSAPEPAYEPEPSFQDAPTVFQSGPEPPQFSESAPAPIQNQG